MKISIIIPAFNEEHRLAHSISKVRRFLKQQRIVAEVIIVVEKSTDNTLARAQAATTGARNFKVIANRQQRGKGYAVKSGMLQAKGAYLFFMDADLSTDLSAINHFLKYFKSHPEVDILIGSRQHPKSRIKTHQSWPRQNMGRLFNIMVQRLVLSGISDTQCGFKAFRKPAAHNLFKQQTIDGFAFDVEILYLAQQAGYQMKILPVTWRDSTSSKVGLFTEPFKMMREIWRLRQHTGKRRLMLSNQTDGDQYLSNKEQERPTSLAGD